MDFNFSDWWNSLTTLQQIYWGFAIPFSLIFLLQMIMTFVGGDMDTDGSADFDVETDDGAGFQFFTIKNFVGFFTLFSWTGIACLDSGLSGGLSVVISIGAGILMMVIMAAIFYYFSKLTDSGNMSAKNAIGGIGEVYLPILSGRSNIGKVSIKVQGSLRELDAITDDDQDLPTGAVVTVTDITSNDTLIVTKSK
ncbi:NfeD family protein [Marinoscillum sp. 108]|jgi:membrane protein implicated in regulation of membrane protease activity|uniref:NfeD family protein n=1 Tax=Marinoscillum luteum TaxID=861051 RepID=A0ABW7NCS4_9BACT|nr:hypothetical protein [Marinoscillum sp. 108]VXD18121.1 conserved membrane hypothetical protein [Marinoscillum sp. 108]